VTVLLLAATLGAFGALVIRDVSKAGSPVWVVLNAGWVIAILATGLTTAQANLGQLDWLMSALVVPNVASLVTLGGFLILSIYLLATVFRAFYVARLPEVANRALFWVLVSVLMLVGVALTMSGTDFLMLIGILLLPIGIAGATYAELSYRVMDIRSEFGAALRTFIVLIIGTIIIDTAIVLATNIDPTTTRAGAVFVTLALGAALLYLPIRQVTDAVMRRMLSTSMTDPTDATRRYSQEVSKAVELDQLADTVGRTLAQVMRLRRSGLVLVDNTPGVTTVEVRLLPSRDTKEIKGYLTTGSAFYRQLARTQAPLSQFDIEFNPTYKDMPDSEKWFLEDIHMSAFAPIIADNTLIGILVGGPKINDAPFYPHDLELLATMANQTAVALRNARLVADLRQLNESMKSLNVGLEATKDQMEKLDSVKTDFVTIASHELRTPLAQIRGYTDIIDALNESEMLEKDQASGLVGNLRKATERMEELIAAMLDVSQIDVNAMDLRFAQSSLESVMRMAIEPLTDAIKQRKLTLSARGLRGLPAIQADMQRLVQAFRNVIVNAIKFTPDGGRIEITATIQPADKPGTYDHILVSIADSGVGIEKENLELIFQKFFRAYDPSLHSTGDTKFMGAGPGLGLTIAKGVIEGHGGKIWAESAGHNMDTYPGTTFYVLLPVSPPEDARRVLAMEGQTSESMSTEPTLIRSQL
jgi:signal transduction histidine kinase